MSSLELFLPLKTSFIVSIAGLLVSPNSITLYDIDTTHKQMTIPIIIMTVPPELPCVIYM